MSTPSSPHPGPATATTAAAPAPAHAAPSARRRRFRFRVVPAALCWLLAVCGLAFPVLWVVTVVRLAALAFDPRVMGMEEIYRQGTTLANIGGYYLGSMGFVLAIVAAMAWMRGRWWMALVTTILGYGLMVAGAYLGGLGPTSRRPEHRPVPRATSSLEPASRPHASAIATIGRQPAPGANLEGPWRHQLWGPAELGPRSPALPPPACPSVSVTLSWVFYEHCRTASQAV